MAETNSSSGAGSALTDADKIALLVALVIGAGGPKWNGFELPPGRTANSCYSVWNRMKTEARKSEAFSASSNAPPKIKKRKKASEENNGEGAESDNVKKEDGAGEAAFKTKRLKTSESQAFKTEEDAV